MSLHQNRWLCDCHLLELRGWLGNSTAVPRSEEPRCSAPQRLAGERVAATPRSEFACVPEVSPTTMYHEVIEGKNMSLECTIRVSADPRMGLGVFPFSYPLQFGYKLVKGSKVAP